MNDIDANKPYEELLEFVYVSPFALARVNEAGVIDMMNAMGANLLLEFAETTELTNLFDILDAVDPDVRKLVLAFTEERGTICEGHRIAITRAPGEDDLVLSLNLQKLGPGRIMAAFGDISKLEAAHRAQRFLLDNVSDGLVVVDARGIMSAQCSATLSAWLGPPTEGQTLWQYVARKSARFSAELEVAWDALVEGEMPLALCIYQLPARLWVDGKPLGVAYQPLMTGGKLAHVLVVMHDLTAELERERLDAEQHELMAAVSRLSTDREGFRTFVDESAKLVRNIVDPGDASPRFIARMLHTLKGNTAIFGVTSIAEMCHALEDRIASDGAPLSAEERARLDARWADLEARFRSLMGGADGSLTISRSDYAALLALVSNRTPGDELREKVESFALAPLEPQLRRFAEQAVALAERLEKAPVVARADAHGLRCEARRFAPFLSAFVHAVRNAVDHGIETVEERARAGKPAEAKVTLDAKLDGDHVIVSISDDGRGVAWTKLAAKARDAGLPSETEADLVAALFHDGVSSRDVVSETSGRGVGMSALKSECEALGGAIEVLSREGEGTTFRFRFPREALVGRPSLKPTPASTPVREASVTRISVSPRPSIAANAK